MPKHGIFQADGFGELEDLTTVFQDMHYDHLCFKDEKTGRLNIQFKTTQLDSNKINL